jgi:hypothetical protein
MTVMVSARERPLKKPINGIAGCCCERAASGQIAAVLPRSVMNSRRFMALSIPEPWRFVDPI